MVATSAGVSNSTVLMIRCERHPEHHRRQEGEQHPEDEPPRPRRWSGSPSPASAAARRRPCRIARIAPSWISTSKALPVEWNPRKCPASRMCPVELTGMNSVSPSSTPSSAATRSDWSCQGSGPHPQRRFLDLGILAGRPVGVEIALEHRLHRRRRRRRARRARARPPRPRCRGASCRIWSAGQRRGDQPARQPGRRSRRAPATSRASGSGSATISRRRRMIASIRRISSRKLAASGPPSS